MQRLTVETQMHVPTCSTCGVRFAIDLEYFRFLENLQGGTKDIAESDDAVDVEGGWFA